MSATDLAHDDDDDDDDEDDDDKHCNSNRIFLIDLLLSIAS